MQLRAHPRIRGEYCQKHGTLMTELGSPPHTRGILFNQICHPFLVRLTPAYAGNTRTAAIIRLLMRAHPRIRGEYSQYSLLVVKLPGSPPHTRGILCLYRFLHLQSRLTPAYAGNTQPFNQPCRHGEAHPRIRGEYITLVSGFGIGRGSPPHTRGIRISGSLQEQAPRLTPAYAGNTLVFLHLRIRIWAHPRIRGEYRWRLPLRPVTLGSPPHTRGIRHR